MSHRPRKRLGQHFLHDPAVVDRILRAIDPDPQDRVVEIGPGPGALTRPLLERLRVLEAVELDRDLAASLRSSEAARSGRLRVHQADVLDLDLGALAGEGPPLRLVGNLPYNISTPLLFRLFKQLASIRDMHFMLQHEVVARMGAGPGTKAYGRLSVMVQLHCRVEPLFTVGPGAFTPPPRVRSAVVRLVPHGRLSVEPEASERLARVVRLAFGQRRKTLRNALKGLLSAEAMAGAGIDPERRPEALRLEEFATLARLL